MTHTLEKYGTVHACFERQALETPDRVAVVCGNLSMTYQQLNHAANRIAYDLLSNGVGSEKLVMLALERSVDLIACILGVLKSGGAYLPLDLESPPERLTMVVEDAKPSIILTTSSLAKKIPTSSSRLLFVDNLELTDENYVNPDVLTDPKDLAYVMFTSGSTGRPKGVMVEHRGIVRLVKDTDYADFSADNVFLQFAPITFDASTFEIWGALLNGARLSIMPQGKTSLADLGNVIRKDGVTTLWLTAGLFHLMVDERIEDLRPLRQLLAGGDVLSPMHVQKVLNILECDVINGYGPTENTTFTCCYKIPRDIEMGRSIPIGKPVAGSQIFILDEHLRPVQDGQIGEIFIGGDGLSRGYLNQPELTSQRFIANPFLHESSERLYRSGDLGRLLPDGNVEFHGRADNQIKIRGFRIELEEIEAALEKKDAIRGAIAVVKGGSTEDKKLFAFVVTEREAKVDTINLKSKIAETLPAYMVPSRIFLLDSFPLNANGKVDRNALVGMIPEESDHCVSLASSTTETEKTVAGILQEVLGAKAIDINDNFFDLGASSLQIAHLHNRLTAIFGTELKILLLYQYPTVRALARALESRDAMDMPGSGSRARALRQRGAYARQRSINPRR